MEKKAKVLDINNNSNGGAASSFIKLLEPNNNFSNQLQIPAEFITTFNGSVPHRFFIETSTTTKKCWRVEVEQDDGDGMFYFRDGWADFAEAHCLQVGNFLLFEYNEHLIFQVKIYGKNGCEKNTFVDKKETCPPPRPRPSKATIDVETDQETDYDESYESEPKRRTRLERTRSLRIPKDEKGSSRKKASLFSMTRRRLGNVGENNSSFSVLMAKKYQFFQQTFPMAVGLEKKLADKKEVVLQDTEGKCWPITLGHKRTGYAVLIGGWKQFLSGQKVVFGDILNFKFVSENLIQVEVTKSSSGCANHHNKANRSKDTRSLHMDLEQGTVQSNDVADDETVEGSNATKEVECELTGRSSFSFPWSTGKALCYLYIPKAIAKEQRLKNKDSVALRDTHGKYWPLEVTKWRNGAVALTKGWTDFRKGLEIKDGDTLEFEFVSSRRMQVSINNKHESAPRESCVEKPTVNTEITVNMEIMDIKGPASDVLDSTVDMEVMDIKGFTDELLASAKDHSFLLTPPGFKPLEQHLL